MTFFVHGEPKGQPRPRAFARNGMVRMYDPGTAEGWKSLIADGWRRGLGSYEEMNVPVCLKLQFLMPRPKSHFGKGGCLKESAPRWFTGKPDADNLSKAVMDALTQIGAWQDDKLVVDLRATKMYAGYGGQGCLISITKATP